MAASNNRESGTQSTRDLQRVDASAGSSGAAANENQNVGSTSPLRTRPIKVGGNYPERTVTYYQISTSDIRSIGAAQIATTVCAALGTFLLSVWIDFSKDIKLAETTQTSPDKLLLQIADVCFWGWLIFWAFAVVAFVWRFNELNRIKIEHGEPTRVHRFKNWWRS